MLLHMSFRLRNCIIEPVRGGSNLVHLAGLASIVLLPSSIIVRPHHRPVQRIWKQSELEHFDQCSTCVDVNETVYYL